MKMEERKIENCDYLAHTVKFVHVYLVFQIYHMDVKDIIANIINVTLLVFAYKLKYLKSLNAVPLLMKGTNMTGISPKEGDNVVN